MPVGPLLDSIAMIATKAVSAKLGAKGFALAALDHVPVAPVVALGVTVPWWQEWLRHVSDAAALVAPILALLVALAKLWSILRRVEDAASPKLDAGKSAVSAVGAAAGAVAKRSGPVALAGLAIAALVAAAVAFAPGAAKAAPMPAAPAVVGKRRRTADDAGEDGDADLPEVTGAEPKWLVSARAQLGVREWKGKRHNPAIVAWFADAGHPEIKDDETANCAAFVGAHLERNGYPGSKSLAARSYEKWGEPCKPKLGAIVVMWRGSPSSWQGHVGLYVGEDATHVHVLGANQGDAVTVARFPKGRVTAYRWPRSTLKTALAGKAVAAGGAAAVVAETVKSAEPLQTPLREIGASWALGLAGWIGLAAAVVTLAGGVYVAWQRNKDHQTRGL